MAPKPLLLHRNEYHFWWNGARKPTSDLRSMFKMVFVAVRSEERV